MAESIRRSRAKWMTEYIFEKYWTKPTKRKGVVTEAPKNPPKESMTKLGQVTIAVEPHVFDATLYAVKDPKPATPMPAGRPILQHGPPGGSIPPTPKAGSETPKDSPAPKSTVTPAGGPKPDNQGLPNSPLVREAPKPTAASGTPHTPTAAAPTLARESPKPTLAAPIGGASPAPASAAGGTPVGAAPSPANVSRTGSSFYRPTAASQTPRQAPAPATSSQASHAVIQALGQRASQDEHLKELMKRVASGEADKNELATFQRVLDQVNEEFKQPNPEKIYVDGRSLKHFANEAADIIRIVLWSNPNQKSANLVPPKGSDPLIIMLVRSALDDAKLKAALERMAQSKMEYGDCNQIKVILEGHHKKLAMDKLKKERPSTPASPATQQNGLPNGDASSSAQSLQVNNNQALRSKGPPPQAKPDISAVVVEFAGGNGDRYLFPKYSILEYRGAQQVVVSFLLVRKKSKPEYGNDIEQDYYERITVLITAQSGRFLENLARVVAPQEEVRRYMDQVMRTTMRSQFLLLAWRLAREKASEKEEDEANGASGGTSMPKAADGVTAGPHRPAVLWTAKATPPLDGVAPRKKLPTAMETDDEKYQKLIQSAAAKETGDS